MRAASPMNNELGGVLARIKALVAAGDYHYSRKVRDLMEDEGFGTADLERCILSARYIHRVEPDEIGAAIDGNKYTILGRDAGGYRFYTCGKIIAASQGEGLYFFITAHDAT